MGSKKTWKNGIDRFSQLEEDLNEFRRLWHQVEENSEVIKEKNYLTEVSNSILTLDRHAEELLDEKVLGKSATLIHYILQTPWGAPFVGQETLLAAAKTYPDEENENSSLSVLLKQFDEYRKLCTLPLMENLDQIQKEIHEAREEAA